VCLYCHQVRDENGTWHAVETGTPVATDSTRAVCPACYERRVKPQLNQAGTAAKP